MLLLALGTVVLDPQMFIHPPLNTLGDGMLVADAAELVGPPPHLAIYYTCDTSGQIEPCRCSNGQTGGMSRRIGWLAAQTTTPSLLVDAGNVVAGPRDWEQFEFSYLLKGYAEAGYQAVNLGQRELTLGAARLAALGKGEVPFVSCNVTDAGGELLVAPFRVVTLPGGSRVGILGVVEPAPGSPFEPAEDVRVTTPALALERWLPEVRRRSDMIVVLAFMNEEGIQRLAGKFDGIDVIIGGDTYQPTGQPLRFNKTLVGLMTDKGKAIGRMDLSRAPDGSGWDADGRIVMLDETMTPDPGYAALYEQYKSELATKDFRPTGAGDAAAFPVTLPRSSEANHYVGSETCRECHAAAHAVWSGSAHAHALASLEAQNNHYNPRCLPCHVVGYGASDGFVNPEASPRLANVQCESCHGRGAHHVESRKGLRVPPSDDLVRRIDCTACHDAVNSPGFDYAEYWKKIAHDGEETR